MNEATDPFMQEYGPLREITDAEWELMTGAPGASPDQAQHEKRKASPSYVVQDVLGPPEGVSAAPNDGGEGSEESSAPEALHPVPLETCFYGPLGAIAEAIAPHTEADPMAILVPLLTAFGNVMGFRRTFA